MNVVETELPGVLILEPKVFGDERGFFMETWNQAHYEEAGLPARFVQDNLSFSGRGVSLRRQQAPALHPGRLRPWLRRDQRCSAILLQVYRLLQPEDGSFCAL